MELTLTAMSNGPAAIGRDPQTGRAIFVPFAIAGEKVRVEIVEERPTFARARLLEVLEPSPQRTMPACQHFGVCGGCHYQHMTYAAQLEWKRQIVIEQLARLGGIENPPVQATLPSPDPLHYRNHVQFTQDDQGRLEYVSVSPGRPVLAIQECPIARPEIMQLFEQIDIERLNVDQIGLRVGADDETMLIFETDSTETPDVEIDLPTSVAAVNNEGEAVTLIGSDHLIQEINGRAFQVSASSFFQVNNALAEQLVQLALTALGASAGDTVLDLYCGVGLFTSFIAPQVSQVIGVEAFGPAVRDAEVNLDEFENVALYESSVEGALGHIATTLNEQDPRSSIKVILDPPRAGCDKAVIDQLVALAPARIVYISCDPATLARDAKRLAEGGYRLISAQPVDMFPQTHHIETLACFEK